MDIEKMFILLVNIVLIALMIVQSSSPLGYLYSIIFVFVQVVLLVSLLNNKRFDMRHFYLLLIIVLGFLYLILYLLNPGMLLTDAFGYLLIAGFFIGIVLFLRMNRIRHKVEIYSGDDLPKPIPPKKNLFEELEQRKTQNIETDLTYQAHQLVMAEKKLSKITKQLRKKPVKRAKKAKKKAVKRPKKVKRSKKVKQSGKK